MGAKKAAQQQNIYIYTHNIYNNNNNSDNNHKNDNTIIYGMDSDLIMLSLNHKKYTNSIYLYRETPHFINSLDSTLDPQHKYLIDINQLANQIYYLLTDKSYIPHETPNILK